MTTEDLVLRILMVVFAAATVIALVLIKLL